MFLKLNINERSKIKMKLNEVIQIQNNLDLKFSSFCLQIMEILKEIVFLYGEVRLIL